MNIICIAHIIRMFPRFLLRVQWIGLLVLLSAILLGCSGASGAITVNGISFDEEKIAQGQELYAQYCAVCHGANGEGQFPEAPLVPDETGRFGAPPHNGNGHTSHHPDDWLINYVREGGVSLLHPEIYYPMPAFGNQLSNEQIVLVIAYIKTIWNTS